MNTVLNIQGMLLFFSSTFVLTLSNMLRKSTTLSLLSSSSSTTSKSIQYVNYDNSLIPDCIVVDCTHPHNQQITHHLKYKNQKSLSLDLDNRGDSTTDSVLNIIKTSSSKLNNFKYVTSNHFDIDSFLSTWCIINPNLAIKYEKILRDVGRIGDFRELILNDEYNYNALKIACWLNSEERRLFYRPFESMITSKKGEEEGEDKFKYFLPIFENIIENPNQYENQWKDEYNQVLKEYNEIHINKDNIKTYDDIGLVIVRNINPGHYYSLFSTSYGYDIILAQYSNNRYELEIKYTTYIDLGSRPSLPRCELQHLCKYLNEHDKLSNQLKWNCNRITDSGPIMRIDDTEKHLSKAERYGHPYERPIYPSSIDSKDFENIIVSYFQFAYNNIMRKKDWSWNDYHKFNQNINWKDWII